MSGHMRQWQAQAQLAALTDDGFTSSRQVPTLYTLGRDAMDALTPISHALWGMSGRRYQRRSTIALVTEVMGWQWPHTDREPSPLLAPDGDWVRIDYHGGGHHRFTAPTYQEIAQMTQHEMEVPTWRR